MATTRSQLRQRAAQLLGITRLGQARRAEYDARLTDAYATVYADLKKDALNTWASTSDAINDALVPHLAALMAFECCDDIGVSNDRYARIMAKRNVATGEIRRLVKPNHESLDDPVDF